MLPEIVSQWFSKAISQWLFILTRRNIMIKNFQFRTLLSFKNNFNNCHHQLVALFWTLSVVVVCSTFCTISQYDSYLTFIFQSYQDEDNEIKIYSLEKKRKEKLFFSLKLLKHFFFLVLLSVKLPERSLCLFPGELEWRPDIPQLVETK